MSDSDNLRARATQGSTVLEAVHSDTEQDAVLGEAQLPQQGVGIPGVSIEYAADDSQDLVDEAVAIEIDRAEAEQKLLHEAREAALAPSGIQGLARVLGLEVEWVGSNADLDAAALLAERHYVKEAPRLSDIVDDESRVMPFRYFVNYGNYANMTEHDGLKQLDYFLDEFIDVTLTANPDPRMPLKAQNIQDLRAQALSIRENLTFIGWPEYHEATKGIGARWKEFLDSDPDTQLCIIAEVGGFERYKIFDDRKSDDVVREDVLLTFSDAELEHYGDRIVGSLDDISHPSDKTRIVMVDDWTISGRQMRELHKKVIMAHPVGREVASRGGVEINLITASDERIRQGLQLNPHKPKRGALPIYAYYKSHEAPAARYEGGSHVTGQHSAVNYDFYDTLVEMFKLHQKLGGPRRRTIGLARIEPWYRTVPSVVTSKNGALTKITPEEAWEQND